MDLGDITCKGCVPNIVATQRILKLHSRLWVCLQLQQLPENVRESLSSCSATEEARTQAMTEYSQRFVTQRLDASCLNAASSGQSSTVNAALTGGDRFQVGLKARCAF